MEHFLGPHLEDHVRMGADPYAARCKLSQQGIKPGAVSAFMDRIDPHEDAVKLCELFAHGVGNVVLVDDGLGSNLGLRQRGEDGLEATGLRVGVAPRLLIAAPQHGDFADMIVHSACPKTNCSTTPASEQASSVCMMPILKRKIATAAAAARRAAKMSMLGRTGALRLSPYPCHTIVSWKIT